MHRVFVPEKNLAKVVFSLTVALVFLGKPVLARDLWHNSSLRSGGYRILRSAVWTKMLCVGAAVLAKTGSVVFRSSGCWCCCCCSSL